jgi:metal-responsive CopG/Arc/MetJ family transcriptional regulator
MSKTTIELEPLTALALERLANAQGRSEAELIREALERYLREQSWPKPSRGGLLSSGRSDVSDRVEEILQEGYEKGQWP